MTRPGVLMVTGAYYPEMSGAGLQCRELVRALRDRVTFTVLTTATEARLSMGEVDGVPVHRVVVSPGHRAASAGAVVALVSAFLRLRRRFHIVHLHGFSKKSLLLILLARLFRKKLVLKLTSVGHDDPGAIRAWGWLAFWLYRRADLFIGVSPRQAELYRASGLPAAKFRLVPNGVDLERFHPCDEEERRCLRRTLSLPEEGPLVLFVGFFSREKCPDVLFEAWLRISDAEGPASGLVFVGATRSRYYEIDAGLADRIRHEAERVGLGNRVAFVEITHEIEKYYRAADIFVLPSSREGLPNALLEAMATGLACVASRLDSITDWVIEHGVNGLLVPPGNILELETALRRLLGDAVYARDLGRRARKAMEERHAISQTAARCLEAYAEVGLRL